MTIRVSGLILALIGCALILAGIWGYPAARIWLGVTWATSAWVTASLMFIGGIVMIIVGAIASCIPTERYCRCPTCEVHRVIKP